MPKTLYWGYIGRMENTMETAVVYWRYTGILENEMEPKSFEI